MEKRIYIVKLGSVERGPFTRSEIAFLYSSDVLKPDQPARIEGADGQLTVADVIYPFADQLKKKDQPLHEGDGGRQASR